VEGGVFAEWRRRVSLSGGGLEGKLQERAILPKGLENDDLWGGVPQVIDGCVL